MSRLDARRHFSIDAIRQHSAQLRRRRTPRHQAYGADVRKSAGVQTHIPDAARAGLRSAAFFETMDSTEEVAEFLREMELRRYVPNFRTQGVTGNILLSLSSAELRDKLGVLRLSDRRAILDAIAYLEQALEYDSRIVLPEDGRILTHLSNDHLFLEWLRFSVLLLTAAVATIQFVDRDSRANKAYILLTSIITCVVSIGASIYASRRYYWMHNMIEFPGLDFFPDNVNLLSPMLVLASFSIILTYGVMCQDTQIAALIFLISI